MIYCLGNATFQDFMYLNGKCKMFSNQIGYLGDGLMSELDLFNGMDGHYHYLDLLKAAIPHITNTSYIVTRMHYDMLNGRNLHIPENGYIANTENYVEGYEYAYYYVYAYYNMDKLFITKVSANPGFTYRNGERIFFSKGRKKELTIEEIAKSTNKGDIISLLPPKENMFSPHEVDYVIPTRLLT